MHVHLVAIGDFVPHREAARLQSFPDWYEFKAVSYTHLNYLQTLEKGSHHDLQGRKLEDLFSSILSDKNNIGRYNGSTTDTGFM